MKRGTIPPCQNLNKGNSGLISPELLQFNNSKRGTNALRQEEKIKKNSHA